MKVKYPLVPEFNAYRRKIDANNIRPYLKNYINSILCSITYSKSSEYPEIELDIKNIPLTLSALSLVLEEIKNLCKRVPFLKFTSFSTGFIFRDPSPDEEVLTIEEVAEKIPYKDLKKLSFYFPDNENHRNNFLGFKPLLEKCIQKLEVLEIKNDNKENTFLKFINFLVQEKLHENNKNQIKNLSLKSFSYEGSIKNASTQDLLKFLSYCSSLINLELFRAFSIPDIEYQNQADIELYDYIFKKIASFNKLEYLNLERCQFQLPKLVEYLEKTDLLSNLKILGLRELTIIDREINFLSRFKNLKELDISEIEIEQEYEDVGDDEIPIYYYDKEEYVSEIIKELRKIKGLEVLKFADSLSIEFEDLKYILKTLNLKRLQIGDSKMCSHKIEMTSQRLDEIFEIYTKENNNKKKDEFVEIEMETFDYDYKYKNYFHDKKNDPNFNGEIKWKLKTCVIKIFK